MTEPSGGDLDEYLKGTRLSQRHILDCEWLANGSHHRGLYHMTPWFGSQGLYRDIIRRPVTTIDDYLERARSQLSRITIDELDAELAAGAVLVDIRPNELRSRDGEIPGALVIDRNVLEWRVAQSSDARQIDLADDQKVIVFCDEGYASSLAAVTLQALGIRGATDLVGGYQAWLSR